VRTSTSKRLLIVEDDFDALEALQAWAEQLGCEVRAARSGALALELSSSFKPQVLITDYLLEDDVSGVDVIVGTRNRVVDVTCVLITGVLHEALRESLHRLNGVLILTKPVNFDRLRAIVSNA
jgi:DNA-binding NtrC family response regulator